MSHSPAPHTPIRLPLNERDRGTDWRMAPEWVRWFNQITRLAVHVEEFTPTLNPSSVSANTTEEQTFTVTGINANDLIVAVNKPSHTTGLGIVGFRASANDTLAITFMNATGSPIDAGEEDYLVLAMKRD